MTTEDIDMARNDKNLRGIYDTLRKNGYNPPEFEEFVSDMQDDRNLQGVHNTLRKHGYTPPEFGEFKRDMFEAEDVASSGAGRVVATGIASIPPASVDMAQRTPSASAEASPEDGLGRMVIEASKAAANGGEWTSLPSDKEVVPAGNGWNPSPSQAAMAKARAAQAIADFTHNTSQGMDNVRRAFGKTTPEGRKRQQDAKLKSKMAGTDKPMLGMTPSPAQSSSGNSGAAPSEAPVTDTLGPVLYNVVEDVTGKKVNQWLMPDGSLTTDYLTADTAAYEARMERNRTANMTINADIRRAEQRLAEAERRLRERGEYLMKEHEASRPSGFTGFLNVLGETIQGDKMGGGAGTTPDDFVEFTEDGDYQALKLAARRQREELQRLRNARSNMVNGDGFMKNYLRSTGQTLFDIDNWDFGKNTFRDARTMMELDGKIRRGDELTDAESNAITELYLHNGIMERFGDLGNGDRWGNISGTSLSFMKDFLLTGGFSGIQTKLPVAASKRVAMSMAKRMGGDMAKKKIALEIAENGLKGYLRSGGKGAMRQALASQGKLGMTATLTTRALGVQLEDLAVRAPIMTFGIQGQSTAAEIIQTKLGPVKINEKTGTLEFANEKGWTSAVWETGADQIIENYSEMWGAHLPDASDVARFFGARNLTAAILRSTREGAGTVLSNTSRFLSRAGLDGYVGEVGEEYYGQVWRTLAQLDSSKDNDGRNLLLSGQFHGDIWGGMAMSIGLTGGGAIAGNYGMKGMSVGAKSASYIFHKRNLSKANARAAAILVPDEWETMRAVIDNADNDMIGAVAEQVIQDTSLSDKEREAIMDYMEKAMVFRGYNLGEVLRRRAYEQLDPDEDEICSSYLDGYEAETPKEMNDARNMYDYQRARLVSELASLGSDDLEDIIGRIDNDPVASLRAETNPAMRDMLLDYINAKTVRDGMMQRVNDDAAEQIVRIDAMIDARVNDVSGMMQPVTMSLDHRQVYVVGGSLAVNDDGTIDRIASDRSVVVRDAQTGKLEFVDPGAILSAGDVIDPTMAKSIAADNIRQQTERRAADAMNGVLSFNPGEVVQINDGGGLIDVTIVGPLVDKESGVPVDGQVIVQFANGQQTTFAKEQLQAFADAANLERLDNFEQERAANRAQQQAAGTMRPQFVLNDEFTILNNNGIPIRGSITGELDEDGTVEIYTDEPINGNHMNRFTPAELEEMFDTYNGRPISMPEPFVEPTVETGNNDAEIIPENGNIIGENIPTDEEATEPQPSALSRVPVDEQGQPKYDEADPDTAWDAIVEQAQGDEATAAEVVADIVSERQDDFNAAEKALNKTKEGKPEKRKKNDPAPTMAERIAAKNAAKEALAEAQAIRDRAKAILDHWKNIAGTKQRREAERRSAEDAEARRRAEERAAEEARLRAEREEAERIALNGVPDWAVDTPADARARGYRRNGPQKVDRPEIIDNHAIGNAVEVKFGDDVMPTGNVVVIEASQLHPSHRDGQRNPAHFLDEAQPKERKDAASRFAAAKIAEGMRPEEITSSITAFTGAPSINARGEVIQGNNRSEALRIMYDNYADSAAKYKQYLIDHAAEFGLTPEAIEAFEQPVLVNMLDVSDENAITLGQYVAQDTESGGIERIKPKNAVQKMGGKIRNFANLLLRSADDEASFAQLVDANGVEVLKWMNQQGFITNTQYTSAFDSKGNLSAEAANDLKGIMYQSIFTGGSTRLEEMFNKMPAKAQRAILATAFRDYDSAFADRMISEIQQSIIAFDALMGFEQFRDASNAEATQNAVEAWKKQYAFDDVSGEPYLPSETFSNFALALAAMYKGHTQRHIQSVFNMMYDIVQGTEQDNLFEAADKTPKPLAEAIRRVLNLEYQPVTKPTTNNGTNGSSVLDINSEEGQDGRPGSDGNADGAEQSQEEAEPSDGGTGTASDSGQGGELATKEEIEAIIASMKAKAQIVPFIEITENNWRKNITTPLGVVKMGENQKEKLFAKGREFQYGMLLETLGSPDIILEEADKQDNIFHERPSSYLFIKTFQKEDGSKYVHFESVTVSQEGMEVSISSHIIRENQLRNKMKSDRLLYKATALDDSANSSAEQPINQGGSLSSDGKGNTLPTYKQGIDSKSSLEGLVKAAEDDVLCRPVTDKATLDRLNSEQTIKVYRAMQMIDGGLRPPMSAKVDGQLRDATEVGVWEEAEEHPEMADENGRFKLDKGNGKSIKAAYNPYIHTSRSPINDQFSSAWSRPELVTVEVEVPVSELTSEYHAEKAKDTVGEKEWKSGPVGRALAKIGQARRVILSRWSRVVRVVPVEEVAEAYAQRLNAHGIEVPFNTVPPALREALVERGVKIGKPEKGNAGSASLPAFEQWISEQERQRMGDGYGAYSDAEVSFANDPVSKVLGKNRFSKKRQAEFAARERQRMVNRIQELAERMHLDNVEIVTDASQLEGKRAKAKGFYSKRTGKITIVIPNNVSTIDAEQTLLHEAVAHYGLRQLFGEQFNTFLDNVYQSADESIRRKIAEMSAQNGWDFRTATEEYLAGLAEDTNFSEAQSYAGWWSEIKRLFLDMLEKIGFEGFRDKVGVVLTDNELRYILWRSYENLAEPGRSRSIFGEAADVARQALLKTGNYAEYGIEAEYAAEPSNVAGVNERFNGQLDGLNEENADKTILMLGRPSSVLLAGGVTDKPMKLYGNKVMKKMKKHGFELSELYDLPMAVAHPIGIFDNLGRAGNRSILTELKTQKGNVLVTIDLGKGGDDIDFNIVSSVFGKGEDNVVDWIERGLATYINKRKALNYLHHSALRAEALSSSRLESAANIVNSFENPTIEEEELFRPGDFSPRDRVIARDAYDRVCASGGYQFKEAMQDSMLGLKELYKAINGKRTRIEDVPGFENAYLYENRMSSTNAGEQHEYFLRHMKPLLKEIGRIAGANKRKRRELTDYLMAKHGLERNEYMRNEAAAKGEDTDRDFAGLIGLTGETDWRNAEATAKQWVDDYERMVDTTALWDALNKATRATLEKVYLSGIISKETYEKTLGMYDHYIPLRGWDATTSEQVYGYLTSREGPLGGSIMKRAVGRESMADDPIATIAMMADDAIRQGNRNLMKQRFLNFVLNHPSDLVSLSDLWLKHDDVTDEWAPVFADIEATDTADEIAQKVEAFEQRMEALRTANPDKYKKGREAQHIPYKVVRNNLREHQILIKRNGRTFVATINGNPRAAQALNGLTNPDVDQNGVVGNMLKAATWVNRQLSAFYTTRNPDFVVSNLFRDMLYSNCMTWVKESPRYALRFHKNFGRVNPGVMRRLLGRWENGTLDKSNRLENMFYQFMKNGGESGYTNVRDIEGHKRVVAAELKKQGSTGRKVWATLGMQLDLLNRSAENCARFAAFVTSRDFGRSIDRAIYDAKEISVNFNKKGSGGKMVNANGQTALGKAGSYLGGGGRLLYVFWNAGIQGFTNFGRQAKLHPAKFTVGATTMFTLGYVIPLLAQMLGYGDGDDDDKNAYYNLPEYVRRSNICFYAGDQWITIPLPIEFRAMYGLGELAHGVISGNERYSDEELGHQIAAQVSQVLPLDMLEGGGGISPLIPSAAKPFTEAYILNKGWTGLPVYKDTPFNKDDPEWTKAYASTDTHLVDFAKWLNEVSGGDDFKKGSIDINPAKIEYLLNGTFGGLFTFPNKLKKAGETMSGNRDFEWRNMPIANRLIKSGDERTAYRKLQNEYFKYSKEYEATGRLIRKYGNAEEDGLVGYAEKVAFLEVSPEYARWEIFDCFKPDIDIYRELIASETSKEEKKKLETEMYSKMRELVDAMHNPDGFFEDIKEQKGYTQQ